MTPQTGRADGSAGDLVGRDAFVERVVVLGQMGPGVAVVGVRGSGRTAVLAGARAGLEASGTPVVVLEPTGSGAAPFSTLSPLLGPDVPEAVDADALARCSAGLLRAAGAWADRASDGDHDDADLGVVDTIRRPVVLVDGLHEIDDASASVLHQMAAAGRVSVVGSAVVDPGDQAPSNGWWAAVLDRVELGPLGRDAADALAERLVGGPIDAAGRERLWELVRGHPGWLVAAVAAAHAAGSWERNGGLFTLADDLGTVVDPDVLARVDATPAEVRSVLRALATVGRLPIEDAEALGGPARLTDAERRGLVRVDEDEDGSLWCAVASDLVATAVRADLDPAAERDAWARVAEILRASSSSAPEVAMTRGRAVVALGRTGVGRVGATLTGDDVDVLVAGAEAALELSRWDDAVELATPAWRGGGDRRALTALTLALGFVADHEAIQALAAEVAARPLDPENLVHLGTTVAISQFHRGDPAGAFATVERLRSEHPDDAAQSLLDVFESRLRSFAGDQDAASELATRWIDHPDVARRVDALTVAASVDANRGLGGRARAGYDAAFAQALAAPGAPMSLAGTPYLFRLSVVADDGGFDEAAGQAEKVERDLAATGDETAHGWLALHLGRCHLRAGRPLVATRWFGEAVSDLRRLHRPGWLAHPAAGLVAAHALAGDLDAAREARAAWAEIPDHAVALFRGEEIRMAAWLDVVEGRTDVAVEAFLDAAARSRAAGAVPYEAGALHDVARVGDGDGRALAADRLEELALGGDSPLVAAHARQARALCGDGSDEVAAVAADYEALGAWLDAAESWAEAARRSVDDRGSAQARRGLERVALHHEAVTTPLLGPAGERPALTGREAEVAAMVVAGASRQEIAEHLYVSVRTVDSHLQRVYRKLGVRGREELVEVLG